MQSSVQKNPAITLTPAIAPRRVRKHRAWHWTAAVAAAFALHGAALWALQIKPILQTANAAPVPAMTMIKVVISQAGQPRPAAPPPPPPIARPVKAKTELKSRDKSIKAAVLPPPRVRPIELASSSGRFVPLAQPEPESITQLANEEIAQTVSAAPDASDQTNGRLTGAVSAADTTGLSAQERGDVVQPSADAAYLRNPPPDYPSMSRLRHESGTVVVRVLIGLDGRAQAAQIEESSGYARLDDAALTTARDRWRYRPGTHGGVPEAMWFNVPIRFVLQ